MEDEIDDEVAEEERNDKDQEEEEDDEGEDTDTIKMYVKSTIRFDDDERNPHATFSPEGDIALYWCWMQYYFILGSSKYNLFYLC